MWVVASVSVVAPPLIARGGQLVGCQRAGTRGEAIRGKKVGGELGHATYHKLISLTQFAIGVSTHKQMYRNILGKALFMRHSRPEHIVLK